MLGCTASQALVHVRREMLVRVMRDEPDLAPVHGQLEDVEFLKKMVQSRKAIASVAKVRTGGLPCLPRSLQVYFPRLFSQRDHVHIPLIRQQMYRKSSFTQSSMMALAWASSKRNNSPRHH
ncbi:hypothetical protein ARMGADRAFT_772853 [Armillaria gallica]|uniref:Uncharacterized protein n=1 Tax=Armillaria gallica TaxID=47427 RepID=A0A2H3CY58_ARMGA|nr:hypothetical protein ARMGADRAFT_772853 [Armillaria gallica]